MSEGRILGRVISEVCVCAWGGQLQPLLTHCVETLNVLAPLCKAASYYTSQYTAEKNPLTTDRLSE